MEPQVRQVSWRAPYRYARLLILYLSVVKKELLARRTGYLIIDILAWLGNGDERTAFSRDRDQRFGRRDTLHRRRSLRTRDTIRTEVVRVASGIKSTTTVSDAQKLCVAFRVATMEESIGD